MNFRPVMRQFSLRCLALIVLVAIPAPAATNVVTTLGNSGAGSLRQAIIDANAAGGGNISISVTGTINLTSSLPPLNNISIIGPGANLVSVRGINVSSTMTNGFRIFEVPLNRTSGLQGITIAHGYGASPGGGSVLNSGVLTLTICTLSSNAAILGGAICSIGGSVTVRECTFNNNNSGLAGLAAVNGVIGALAAGGGIFTTGTMARIEDCSFNNNSAWGGDGASGGLSPICGGTPTRGGQAAGGAAFLAGSNHVVSNCVFSANSTTGGNGGGGCSGGYEGGEGSGGALYLQGSAFIVRCRFFSNRSYGGYGAGSLLGPGFGGSATGGGMAFRSGFSVIADCLLTGNQTVGRDGGAVFRSGSGGSGGGGIGAGTYAINSSLLLSRVTIAQNTAIGGRGGGANSCGPIYFSSGGSGGSGRGGGIAIDNSTVVAVNVTISGNQTGGGNPGTGGCSSGQPGQSSGGGVWVNSANYWTNATVVYNGASATGGGIYGPLSLRNSLVAGNSASSGSDVNSNVVDLGFNLISPTNNPFLGSLTDNGGPTLTHALLPESPAIDAGDDALTGTDQRGYRRLSGAHVDIGAFEFIAPTIAGLRKLTNGVVTLTAVSDTPFNVVANPNVAAPSNQWINLGPATAIGPGVYEFTDTTATNNLLRFFRLRWP